jgi:hypothetical protein
MALRSHPVESYPADQVRGSQIILHQRWEKIVFLGGLAATVLLLVLAQFIWS